MNILKNFLLHCYRPYSARSMHNIIVHTVVHLCGLIVTLKYIKMVYLLAEVNKSTLRAVWRNTMLWQRFNLFVKSKNVMMKHNNETIIRHTLDLFRIWVESHDSLKHESSSIPPECWRVYSLIQLRTISYVFRMNIISVRKECFFINIKQND